MLLCPSLSKRYGSTLNDEKVESLIIRAAIYADDGSKDGKLASDDQRVQSFKAIMDRVFEETSNIATKDILATVIPTNQSAVKMITCECGNRDPACTIRDLKSGDNICLGIGRKGCGRVLQDHLVDEGSEKRNFEDTEDRNHHGSTPDPLMPDHVNLSTRIAAPLGRSAMSTSKFKQYVSDSQRIEEKVMDLTHDDRRTRQHYKAEHKKKVFALIQELAYYLQLHDQVVAIAKIIFARYRDDNERVYKVNSVAGACLIIAFIDILHSSLSSKSSRNNMKAIPESSSKSRDALSPLHAENDEAITMHAGQSMTTWNGDMLEKWIIATVSDGKLLHGSNLSESDGRQIIQRFTSAFVAYINSTRIQSSSSSKSMDSQPAKRMRTASGSLKDLPPLFGTTTAAGREKLTKSVLNPQTSQTETAGKLFLQCNLKLAEDFFRKGQSQFALTSDFTADNLEKIFEVIRQARLRRSTHENAESKQRNTKKFSDQERRSQPSLNTLESPTVETFEETFDDLKQLLGDVMSSSSAVSGKSPSDTLTQVARTEKKIIDKPKIIVKIA